MNKKYKVGFGISLFLSACLAVCVLAAGKKPSTSVPDGQYLISYLVISVNKGKPVAEFGLQDASGPYTTNNHPFLAETEYDFKDGVYEKGSLVLVSDGGTRISAIKPAAPSQTK